MGGQPAFLLSEYGFGRRRQAVFFIKWFLMASKKEEIYVSLSPL